MTKCLSHSNYSAPDRLVVDSVEFTERRTMIVTLRCKTCDYWRAQQLGWTGERWKWGIDAPINSTAQMSISMVRTRKKGRGLLKQSRSRA